MYFILFVQSEFIFADFSKLTLLVKIFPYGSGEWWGIRKSKRVYDGK